MTVYISYLWYTRRNINNDAASSIAITIPWMKYVLYIFVTRASATRVRTFYTIHNPSTIAEAKIGVKTNREFVKQMNERMMDICTGRSRAKICEIWRETILKIVDETRVVSFDFERVHLWVAICVVSIFNHSGFSIFGKSSIIVIFCGFCNIL